MLRVCLLTLPLLVCANLAAQEPLFIVGPQSTDPVIMAMRMEVERVLASAELPVHWRATGDEIEGKLVVLALRGSCSTDNLRPSAEIANGTALASTAASGDRVMPFVHVSCDQVLGLLGRRLAGARPEARPQLMGRAIGRLVAHELYHYLAQTKHHGGEGVASASVRATELLADRFDFDGTTVAQLRPVTSVPAVPADSFWDDSSGR